MKMKRERVGNTSVLVLFNALVFVLISHSLLMAQQREPSAPATYAVAQGQTGLGVQEHEVGGVDVALLEVKRMSGDTLTVRWQFRNKTQESKNLTKGGGSWSDPYLLSYSAYLIDPVNRKKYLLLRDESGNPIAAKHETKQWNISLAPGQTLTTWAKFPAPPANVEKVSVYLSGVAPFEDIVISK
jgi:hypothetical protein